MSKLMESIKNKQGCADCPYSDGICPAIAWGESDDYSYKRHKGQSIGSLAIAGVTLFLPFGEAKATAAMIGAYGAYELYRASKCDPRKTVPLYCADTKALAARKEALEAANTADAIDVVDMATPATGMEG